VKPLSDQNHYEILETHPSAARDEIERAYRLALATYDDDSLAGYSVFAEGDAAALRERIEAAYRVLSDNRMRSEYDETLVVDPDEDLPPAEPSAPLVPAETMTSEGPLRLRAGGMLHVDDGEGDFDGERLRHFRGSSRLRLRARFRNRLRELCRAGGQRRRGELHEEIRQRRRRAPQGAIFREPLNFPLVTSPSSTP